MALNCLNYMSLGTNYFTIINVFLKMLENIVTKRGTPGCQFQVHVGTMTTVQTYKNYSHVNMRSINVQYRRSQHMYMYKTCIHVHIRNQSLFNQPIHVHVAIHADCHGNQAPPTNITGLHDTIEMTYPK